jgi:hypothetical protein
MTTKTGVDLWERLLEPENGAMTPDAARYLLTLQFPRADIDRMNELAAKARQGTLTREEDGELERYLHVGTRLSILKSKARQSLKQATGAS